MKIYIAGKITGNENYRKEFAKAQDGLEKDGHTVLNPAVLPEGMTKGEYMRICLSMIDISDVVVFLPGWQDSEGANLEYAYCIYVGKATITSPDRFNVLKITSILEEPCPYCGSHTGDILVKIHHYDDYDEHDSHGTEIDEIKCESCGNSIFKKTRENNDEH